MVNLKVDDRPQYKIKCIKITIKPHISLLSLVIYKQTQIQAAIKPLYVQTYI